MPLFVIILILVVTIIVTISGIRSFKDLKKQKVSEKKIMCYIKHDLAIVLILLIPMIIIVYYDINYIYISLMALIPSVFSLTYGLYYIRKNKNKQKESK